MSHHISEKKIADLAVKRINKSNFLFCMTFFGPKIADIAVKRLKKSTFFVPA